MRNLEMGGNKRACGSLSGPVVPANRRACFSLSETEISKFWEKRTGVERERGGEGRRVTESRRKLDVARIVQRIFKRNVKLRVKISLTHLLSCPRRIGSNYYSFLNFNFPIHSFLRRNVRNNNGIVNGNI